jgi:hypothetical protein
MLNTANGNKSRLIVAFNKINKVILNCLVPQGMYKSFKIIILVTKLNGCYN